jgi:hypothetical protein
MVKKLIGIGISTSLLLSLFSGLVLAYGTNTYLNDTTSVPVCNSSVPNKAWLYSVKAAGAGLVDLYWDKVDQATSWTISYGVKPGVYIYGATNIGNNGSRGVRVSLLPSGKYYFVVRANNSCMPGPFSNEWAVQVGGSAPLVATNLTKVTNETVPVVTPVPTLKPVKGQPTALPVVTFAPKQTGKTVPVPTPTPKPQGGFFDWLGGVFGGLFK